MRRSIIAPLGAVFLSLGMAAAAEAQLFGERSSTANRTSAGSANRTATSTQNRAMAAQNRTQSAARQGTGAAANPTTAAENVGTITGTERFLRGSRTADDFVGRSASDAGGFVGAQTNAATAEIRSAIEGELVRSVVNPALNRLLNAPQTRTGMYAPRLKIGFEPLVFSTPEREQSAAAKLSLSPAIRTAGPVEVSLAGRTATLRGAVASEHEKRLAGLMLLMEPGISQVENQLTVSPAAPPAELIPTPISP